MSRKKKHNHRFEDDFNIGSDIASVNIEMLQRRFKFSEKQEELISLICDPKTKAVFISGPAGTSKTYIAAYSALLSMKRDRGLDLLYIRSAIESADKALGSLPGNIDEKFGPYMMPLEDKLYEILVPKIVKPLQEGQFPRISAQPINYLRGANWTDKIVIADECFDAHTYVLTEGGYVRMGDIVANPTDHNVISFNEDERKFERKHVLRSFEKGKKLISEVVLGDGSTVRATANHLFLTYDGWKMLESLEKDDILIRYPKFGNAIPFGLSPVLSTNIDMYEGEVFDIEVEDNHNFVVSSTDNFNGANIVAHNCQNFTMKEFTTLMTRVGENTKLIMCGDPMQSDIGRKSGFNKIFDAFYDKESFDHGVHCFEFDEDDIVRSDFIRFVIKKIGEALDIV